MMAVEDNIRCYRVKRIDGKINVATIDLYKNKEDYDAHVVFKTIHVRSGKTNLQPYCQDYYLSFRLVLSVNAVYQF